MVVTKKTKEPAPLVVGADIHGITAEVIDSDAAFVLRKLTRAGHKAYLVGGGVRDLYQRIVPKDFDLSTSASPNQVRKLFRNSRVIGRRFRLVQVFFPGNKIIELSTFRCRSDCEEGKTDQVLAANNTFGSEYDDAFRRDLTINGLFYDIEQQIIIDYVGGVQDLDDRIVRVIGDPDVRISRDPVRMMRAVRHAARSGFAIEDKTWAAIKKHCRSLSVCPVSRIRDELFKDLYGRACGEWVRLAAQSGLLASLLPFYEDLLVQESVVEELSALMYAVDGVQSQGGILADDMLLAMLLLPWARQQFPELNGGLKTGEAFALSRLIRDYLKTSMVHLDIRRALKEQISTTLSLLPLFSKNKGRDWPKWLRKKSYFKHGLLFYSLVKQAGEGVPVQQELWPRAVKVARKITHEDHSGSSRGRGPAYANSKSKGGVFGFRRS